MLALKKTLFLFVIIAFLQNCDKCMECEYSINNEKIKQKKCVRQEEIALFELSIKQTYTNTTCKYVSN